MNIQKQITKTQYKNNLNKFSECLGYLINEPTYNIPMYVEAVIDIVTTIANDHKNFDHQDLRYVYEKLAKSCPDYFDHS